MCNGLRRRRGCRSRVIAAKRAFLVGAAVVAGRLADDVVHAAGGRADVEAGGGILRVCRVAGGASEEEAGEQGAGECGRCAGFGHSLPVPPPLRRGEGKIGGRLGSEVCGRTPPQPSPTGGGGLLGG